MPAQNKQPECAIKRLRRSPLCRINYLPLSPISLICSLVGGRKNAGKELKGQNIGPSGIVEAGLSKA